MADDDTRQAEEKVVERDKLAHAAEENAAQAHRDAATAHEKNAGVNK